MVEVPKLIPFRTTGMMIVGRGEEAVVSRCGGGLMNPYGKVLFPPNRELRMAVGDPPPEAEDDDDDDDVMFGRHKYWTSRYFRVPGQKSLK